MSQSLIYHQVRKYLLRLRQEHVKFWRPQILLLVNDPRRQYKLIQFGNAMKKGSLYILGHVIVDENFDDAVPEVRRQQTAWTKFIDVSRIKAFVNVAVSPKAEWGIRNIVLTAGLGGMRPNIALMGFYNLEDHREQKPLIDHPELAVSMNGRAVEAASTKTFRRLDGNEFEGALPTDSCRAEPMMSATSYVLVLEDLLLRLQINVAVSLAHLARLDFWDLLTTKIAQISCCSNMSCPTDSALDRQRLQRLGISTSQWKEQQKVH